MNISTLINMDNLTKNHLRDNKSILNEIIKEQTRSEYKMILQGGLSKSPNPEEGLIFDSIKQVGIADLFPNMNTKFNDWVISLKDKISNNGNAEMSCASYRNEIKTEQLMKAELWSRDAFTFSLLSNSPTYETLSIEKGKATGALVSLDPIDADLTIRDLLILDQNLGRQLINYNATLASYFVSSRLIDYQLGFSLVDTRAINNLMPLTSTPTGTQRSAYLAYDKMDKNLFSAILCLDDPNDYNSLFGHQWLDKIIAWPLHVVRSLSDGKLPNYEDQQFKEIGLRLISYDKDLYALQTNDFSTYNSIQYFILPNKEDYTFLTDKRNSNVANRICMNPVLLYFDSFMEHYCSFILSQESDNRSNERVFIQFLRMSLTTKEDFFWANSSIYCKNRILSVFGSVVTKKTDISEITDAYNDYNGLIDKLLKWIRIFTFVSSLNPILSIISAVINKRKNRES